MTAKSNLPMRLEDIYVEPSSWDMPSGIAFVRFLTNEELRQDDYSGCTLAAENSAGEVCGAFGSVSAALIALTSKGCQVKWNLYQGKDYKEVI